MYLTQVRVDFCIDIDEKTWWDSWRKITRTFPYLTCSLDKDQKNLVPKDANDFRLSKKSIDLSHQPEKYKKKALEEIIEDDIKNVIPTFSQPLFRLTLIKIDEKNTTFLFTHHHILLDFSSFSTLLSEAIKGYLWDKNKFEIKNKNSIELGGINKKSPLTFSQDDFEILEKKPKKPDHIAPLPGRVNKKASIQNYKSFSFTLPSESKNTIDEIKKKHQVTTSEILYSAWSVVLCKYGFSNQAYFGATRRLPENKNKQGLGLSFKTVPLIAQLNKNTTTSDVLDQINKQVNHFREEVKLNKSSIYDAAPQETTFECIIDYKNKTLFDMLHQCFPGVIKNASFISTTEFPLMIEIWLSKNNFSGRVNFDPKQFSSHCISQLSEHLYEIIAYMAKEPNKAIGDIELAKKSTKRQSLKKIKNTTETKCQSLFQAFCHSAKKFPKKTAVIFEGNSISYEELESRCLKIASQIKKLCISSKPTIAIYTKRSIGFIISCLSANATNSSIVILDPSYPQKRVNQILSLSKPNIVITDDSAKKMFEDNELPTINIDKLLCNKLKKFTFKINNVNSVSHVLFTSGSTGEPKGVYIPQDGVINTIRSLGHILNLSESDVFLAVANSAFDMAIMDIWLPLSLGSTLIFSSEIERRTPKKLLKFIYKYKVSIMEAPPALWQSLIDAGLRKPKHSIKLLSGGEVMTPSLANVMLKIGPTYNLYGPTENSIYTTIDEIKNPDAITIGHPIPNVFVRVVDKFGKIAAPYAIGEIEISGLGLSPCYIESDIKSPYKTRDIAYIKKDNRIVYLDRIDNQIKIYGHRIEKNEIIKALEIIDGVQSAFIKLSNMNNYYEKKIIAYILPKNQQNLQALREKIILDLSRDIPYYMIPTSIKFVSNTPTSENGKIEHDQLETFAIHEHHQQIGKNDIFEKLISLWRKVLNTKNLIKSDSSFFELGGNSILATQLLIELQVNFNRPSIGIVDIYRYPTIAQQASLIIKNDTPKRQMKHVRNKLKKSNRKKEIAIIGTACRFPDANTTNELWDILINKKTTYNRQRLTSNTKNFIPISGILKDTCYFDYKFFNYTAAEATLIDPQHRIFLEICWEALVDSGYVSQVTNSSIGVFAGCGENYYNKKDSSFTPYFSLANIRHQINTSPHFIASRAAHKLGLSGPAISIDTACSTSLVTVIKACQSLEANECQMAIAGGASIILPEHAGYLYQEDAIFSSDGICRPFDVKANGTVPSSGAGVVLLKPLEDALQDNDYIYGVINSYGLNNDGANKASFTAPSVTGQIDCLSQAFHAAPNIAKDVTYIEAHGTGTKVGDPIELTALKEVYKTNKNPIAIGSLKANIGHTNQAAGIAGLLKVLLMMKNGAIPSQVNYTDLNPDIDFHQTPFYISRNNQRWKSKNKVAAISSFGLGGTNAHIIVSSYPESPNRNKTTEPYSWDKSYLNINNRKVDKTCSGKHAQEANIKENLLALWKELFGLDQIETNCSFFDLGGDSISALEFIEVFKKRTTLNLNVNILTKHQTIDSLTSYIEKYLLNNQKKNDFIVCIQDRKAEKNLFFLHPIGGTSYCYLPMSEYISNKYNIYAINDADIEKKELNYNTIKGLAKLYASQIQEIQPSGPYNLAGLSLGGVLATEIAAIMSAKGEDIGFVGLIESWAMVPGDLLDMNIFFEIIQKQHEIILDQIKKSPYNIDKTPWIKIQKARMEQLINHQQTCFDFPVILFKAKETNEHFKSIDDDYNHWKNYTMNKICRYICPGNHETILYGKNGINVAKIINKHLEATHE